MKWLSKFITFLLLLIGIGIAIFQLKKIEVLSESPEMSAVFYSNTEQQALYVASIVPLSITQNGWQKRKLAYVIALRNTSHADSTAAAMILNATNALSGLDSIWESLDRSTVTPFQYQIAYERAALSLRLEAFRKNPADRSATIRREKDLYNTFDSLPSKRFEDVMAVLLQHKMFQSFYGAHSINIENVQMKTQFQVNIAEGPAAHLRLYEGLGACMAMHPAGAKKIQDALIELSSAKTTVVWYAVKNWDYAVAGEILRKASEENPCRSAVDTFISKMS